ncbi:MAG: hypothetical protein JXR70_19500 [Spirochaetales bacterium]|nr:hypothetical protein [Spirochaetales bacterium]
MILDVLIFTLCCISGIISFMVLQKDREGQRGKDDSIARRRAVISGLRNR